MRYNSFYLKNFPIIFIATSVTKPIIEDRMISFIKYCRRKGNIGRIYEDIYKLENPFLHSNA